jgi:hypothetical protein
MTGSVLKSGAWRPINKISVLKSGAWHTVSNGWVLKSGAWHPFFNNLQVQLFNTTAARGTTAPTNAAAVMEIRTDGHLWSSNIGGTMIDRFAWLVGGTVGSFEAAMTYLSGDALTSGPASGVFANLGSTQQWILLRTAIGSASGTQRCDIRPAGGGAILATATMTFNADKS